METKELKINIPEGYEIDRENSTFECIKFKPVTKRWRDGYKTVHGCIIDVSDIRSVDGIVTADDHAIFYNSKQAKSAKAMAIISQIMANDERFGGPITDEEWENYDITKWTIERSENKIIATIRHFTYTFLAFHTAEQCNLFLAENIDLIKDYLMID